MVLLAFGILSGVLAASASKRVRDVFFVVMVFLAPTTELFDVNFVSRDWYRGTTRGFEVSVVDILAISILFSSVLVPRRGQSRWYWPASFGLLLLFFFYSCVNVLISDPKLFGLFELSKFVRGGTIFLAVAFYLRTERELRLLLYSLAVLVCFEGLLTIKQRYLNGEHRVSGSIGDSNSMSFFFCTTAPVLAAACVSRLPKYLKALAGIGVALACVGVVLTITRMGVMTMAVVLAGVAVATVSLKITARKVIIACVVVVGVSAILGKSWETLQARFGESNLKTEYGNKRLLGRGYYIRIAREIGREKLFGVGLNNWSYHVSNRYGPRLGYKFVPYKGTDIIPSEIIPPDSNVDVAQAAPAHSLFALTLGELGYPGFFLLALLWLRWFQMTGVFLWKRTPEPMRRIAVGLFFSLVGVFIHSQTEWVFRHSPVFYIIHILLGAIASLYYVRRQEKRARKAAAQAEWNQPPPYVEAEVVGENY